MGRNTWWTWFVVMVVFAVALLLSACGGETSGKPLKLAPASLLPPEIAKAPAQVREAYQFAIANQEYLSNFPCYCGCVAAGHKSNLDCYIREVKPDGTIVFDDHAFG